MPKVLSSALAFTCAVIPSEAITRQQQRLFSRQAANEPDDTYPELWYDQTLDHFSSPFHQTQWKQRYFANFDHYKPGGPVFLYIGGEGPLRSAAVSGRTVNFAFAEQFSGATVALEHRFYGKSQPFDSLATEHLELLTSRQALNDLNQFSQWLVQNRSLASSKFFCVGGSYPGNLASWYRQKFPDATSGCFSASAPVEAVEDWPGFGQMVWKAFSTDQYGKYDEDLTVKLYAGYQQLSTFIQHSDPKSIPMVEKELNACPGTIVSQADRDNWDMTVAEYVGEIMQYNNTHTPHLADVRAVVASAPTPLDAALAVTRFLNVTQGDKEGGCADFSIGAFYRELGDTSLPKSGVGNAGRTWTWQTCNEFGYFQTSTAVWKKSNFYPRAGNNRAMWQQVCTDIFQIPAAEVGARIAATNTYYGGKQPNVTRVVYSNGDLDAWSLLGITEKPPPGDNAVVVADQGSHCAGLYAPEEGELPGAAVVRNTVLKKFMEWGVADSAVVV